jgi:transcriptional regulator GlxA family with amidase domain
VKSHQVVFVVFQGCQPLDVTGPYEVFTGANAVLDRTRSKRGRYHPVIAAVSAGQLRTESGLGLVVDVKLGELLSHRGSVGTILVVGGLGVVEAMQSSELVGEIERLARSASRIASVCTGSFLLAAAGVLNGKVACTHWAYARELAERFPSIEVDAESLFRIDGCVWSSAGVCAGIDLALAMVETDHGTDVAREVARALVVHFRRSGGQSQFANLPTRQVTDRDSLRAAQDVVLSNPGGDHRIASLATVARMSERNFLRLFTKEVGVTPAKYVEMIRVEAVCRELELSVRSIDAIATEAGFGSADAMRRTFLRLKGVSPSDYRNRFAAR